MNDVAMQPRVITVSDISELASLVSWRTMLGAYTSVIFDLPDMEREKLSGLESQFNRQLSRCGCAVGGISGIAGLCGYVVFLTVFRSTDLSLTFSVIAVGLGITGVAAVLGKGVAVSFPVKWTTLK